MAKEWHPTLNGDLTPYNILAGSGNKVWWICSENKHDYEASPNNRTNKERPRGCPYCARQKVCEDNCLATTHKELAKEWHPTLNGDLTPYNVMSGSHKKFWWICPEKQHAYEETPKVRSLINTGCPYCSNYRVNEENCLATTHPEVAKEWHPTLNGDLTPLNIIAGFRKNVWWFCQHGHNYPASPKNRTGVNNTGCRYCKTSKGEEKIEEILKSNRIEYSVQYKFDDCVYKRALPFDFAIFHGGTLVTLIEFDGIQHFEPMGIWGGADSFASTQIRDQIKNEYCKKNKIPLIRIPYTEFDTIEERLIEELRKFNIDVLSPVGT